MSQFNHKQIKTININLNSSVWNPETHNILLAYDSKSLTKFSIKMIKVDNDVAITDTSDAQQLLKQFRISK